MPQRKNTSEPRMPSIQSASDHQYRVLTPLEGIEPELQSVISESVSLNADSATHTGPCVSENKVELRDYSVSQAWHRPYIEALVENDGAGLGALIAETERAIVGRFLELLASSVATDEFVDLQNAAYAITELKKASAIAYTPQHLVA